jgi:hypothetical protein
MMVLVVVVVQGLEINSSTAAKMLHIFFQLLCESRTQHARSLAAAN